MECNWIFYLFIILYTYFDFTYLKRPIKTISSGVQYKMGRDVFHIVILFPWCTGCRLNNKDEVSLRGIIATNQDQVVGGMRGVEAMVPEEMVCCYCVGWMCFSHCVYAFHSLAKAPPIILLLKICNNENIIASQFLAKCSSSTTAN